MNDFFIEDVTEDTKETLTKMSSISNALVFTAVFILLIVGAILLYIS